jgi:hypothetical protein
MKAFHKPTALFAHFSLPWIAPLAKTCPSTGSRAQEWADFNRRCQTSVSLVMVATALVSCAHISFHDSNDPKRRNIGVEYYKPKLFLLLTKTAKEGYKADVVTLPDLLQPRYALLHPGYGSSNLSLKLNNGILTDVGQQVDTKIPETITALGSLATAAGGLAKLVEGQAVAAEEKPFRLFEIIMREGEFKLKEVRIELE